MNAETLEKLKTLLIGKQLSIATAESLTCGHLQAALGSVSGSSAYFAGGITAYNLRQKVRLLSIDKQHAESVNCVSSRVALEMAQAACLLFQTDLGIGTTGYAEPCPEQDILHPMAYIAICRNEGGNIRLVMTDQVVGQNLGRVEMQNLVTEQALLGLLRYLGS